MSRMQILAAATCAALAAAFPAAAAATPTLNAVVGPGFTISLKQGGKKVAKLKAGTYLIVVADKATTHDFHLIGPGVNKKTSVKGKGTTKWTVTLKKGTYRYVCDPHKTLMKGSFTVT